MEQNSRISYGDKVCDAVKKMRRYFDETDIQEEIANKFKKMCDESIKMDVTALTRLCSSPFLGVRSDSQTSQQSSGTDPKLSMQRNPLQKSKTESSLQVSSPKVDKAEYRKQVERFYSNERRNFADVSAELNDEFDVKPQNPSNKAGMGRAINDILSGGKLYISSEYVSDDNALYIYVTQHGNVTTEKETEQPYLTFQQIDYRGVARKKKAKKLKHRKSASDFHHTHAYCLGFKSFDHMNYSGMSIRICLKMRSRDHSQGKITLKMTKVHLADVELDPTSLEQTLFF